MERARTEGAELEYEVSGIGDPAVLVHGAFIADVFRPLMAEPTLTTRHRVIAYHRRGYLGSSDSPEPVGVARQAADCRALLRHLGFQRAHVVGHSYGGVVALQLALDEPDVVHSLVLLEPALGKLAEMLFEEEHVQRVGNRFGIGGAVPLHAHHPRTGVSGGDVE